MRHSTFTCALLAALPFVVSVPGVHVEFNGNGRLAIDVDNKDDIPRPRLQVPASHQEPPNPRYRKTDEKLGEYEVDLGYEIHQGHLTESGKYVNFSNIPYAQAPIDDYRFAHPAWPEYPEKIPKNNGSRRAICPQYQVGWVPAAKDFVHDMLLSPVLPSKWKNPISPGDYGAKPELDPASSEDCLLLDVLVPKTSWDTRNQRKLWPTAVIVWIHGGGFIFGSKDQFGSPEVLLDAAETDVIHVSINYRLGAFGFLGGEKYWNDDGAGNLGLLDQKMAIEWVRNNIHYFGGDYRKITAMGQSAGASSILHHITANEYHKPSFQTAIIQSPGFFPTPNDTLLDQTYSAFLKAAGAKNLDELVKVDTKVLMQANADLTFNSSYGLFNFGPTVDGYFTKDLPSKVLKRREQHRGISILIGHTKFDGLVFTPPWIRNNEQLRDHVRLMYPGVPDSVLDEVDKKYPIGKIEFAKEKILKVADFLDDVAIQCNTHFLTEATLDDTTWPPVSVYRYVYNIVPAIHGADVPYTFHPSISTKPAVNEGVAKHWQQSMVNFTQFRDPNDVDSEAWPRYKKDNRKLMNYGSAGQWLIPNFDVKAGDDELDRSKCDYWQDAPYYVPPKRKYANEEGGKGHKYEPDMQERLEMK